MSFLLRAWLVLAVSLPLAGAEGCRVNGFWLGMAENEAKKLYPLPSSVRVTMQGGRVGEVVGDRLDWGGLHLKVGEAEERVEAVLGKPDRFAWKLCGNDTSTTRLYASQRLAVAVDRMSGNTVTMITLGVDYPASPLEQAP